MDKRKFTQKNRRKNRKRLQITKDLANAGYVQRRAFVLRKPQKANFIGFGLVWSELNFLSIQTHTIAKARDVVRYFKTTGR